MRRRVSIAFLCACLAAVRAGAASAPEAYDGSFLLETGETVTGGYFVEGARGRYLYMDTDGLARGGLFEPAGDRILRSIVPPGAIEIEFRAGADGSFDELVWREQGREPVAGRRVHPHRSRAISFESADGTRLAGRLLLPACAGPHPVVVSVHGSGPVNRYGGPYHTFFLRQGVAVLAYDKRGYTTDRSAWREPDLADLAADAAAAVRHAATLDELDGSRIGIVGSSQAGWVVPSAAVAAPETDFIILRAGAAASQLETSLHEVRQELRAAGMSGPELDQAIALRREIYALALKGEELSRTDALVAPYLQTPWYRQAFGEGPLSRRWSARYWAWAGRNLAVAAEPDLGRFPGPVLWFLAERDENVPLVATRAALERAFARAPGADHEIVVIGSALHSFLIPDPAGPPRFASGFFDRMASWMAERGYTGAACRVPAAISDARDGRSYRTVQIGGQQWLAENLAHAAEGSRCYDDSPRGCETHGRLYPWDAALSACPAGWRLPSDADWMALEAQLGMTQEELAGRGFRGSDQGARLRRGGMSGFDVLMSGYRRPAGEYVRRGERAAFWSASEADANDAWHRDLRPDDDRIYRSEVTKSYALAVRCIRDAVAG